MSNLKQIEQLQDYRKQITMTDIFLSGMLAAGTHSSRRPGWSSNQAKAGYRSLNELKAFDKG